MSGPRWLVSNVASKDGPNVSLERENENRYYVKFPILLLQLWLITNSAVVGGNLQSAGL
jgi:hypothetical protein